MPDIFDPILDLESTFYTEGYTQGHTDGVKSGRLEGRALGIEKGFDKFYEAGRLYGKSLVWASRLPPAPVPSQSPSHSEPPPTTTVDAPEESNQVHLEDNTVKEQKKSTRLQPLPKSQRVKRHILVLNELVDPATLPTENTDEAVEEVDDRVKKAKGKVRVIERTIGEASATEGGGSGEGKNDSIEDVRNPAMIPSA